MASQFETHIADTIGAVADLVPWFLERGRAEDRLAVVFKSRAKKVVFSTQDEAWVVDFKAVPVAAQLVSRQLLSGQAFKLDFRKTSEDFPELVRWVADSASISVTDVLRELEPKLGGDLHMAAYCIGQAVTPHKKFPKPEHDAYEIALLLPQYEYQIIPYYAKIGLPLACLLAEATLRQPGDPTWWITYPQLWIRVLASMTADPTLTWALSTERDACEVVGAMFDKDRDYGHLVLSWAACGMDIHTFKEVFRTSDLPADLELWNAEIRKHLPTMVLAIDEMKAYYLENKGVKTKYGRKLRPGQRPSEAVAHIIYGTAEDVAAVAAVACWTNRFDDGTLIKEIVGGPGSEAVRVSGTSEARGMGSWVRILNEICELANPLAPVTLAPIITIP